MAVAVHGNNKNLREDYVTGRPKSDWNELWSSLLKDNKFMAPTLKRIMMRVLFENEIWPIDSDTQRPDMQWCETRRTFCRAHIAFFPHCSLAMAHSTFAEYTNFCEATDKICIYRQLWWCICKKKTIHMSRGLWLWLCAVCKATTLYFYTIKTDSFGLHANFCCTPFAPGNTKQKKCCNTWNGICRTSIAEIAALKNGGKNRGKKVENVFECVR